MRLYWTVLRSGQNQKSDEIAAFTHLRTLNQGNKTLSSYIQEVRRMVDLCNFACVGDCKDRLIRNSIVAGLSSTKAYQQCISKGSNLTLNECIKICQTEDATRRQVQALRPESTDCNDSTPLHHIADYPQSCPRTNPRGRGGHRGSFRGGRPSHRGSIGGACPSERLQIQSQDYMRQLWLMAPQDKRRVQSLRPGMPPLWQTRAFLQSMQTEIRLPTE